MDRLGTIGERVVFSKIKICRSHTSHEQISLSRFLVNTNFELSDFPFRLVDLKFKSKLFICFDKILTIRVYAFLYFDIRDIDFRDFNPNPYNYH